MTTQLKRGVRFRHARVLDPDWTPTQGQRYADAPGAVCVVTATRGDRVYYRLNYRGGEGTKAHAYFMRQWADDVVAEVLP